MPCAVTGVVRAALIPAAAAAVLCVAARGGTPDLPDLRDGLPAPRAAEMPPYAMAEAVTVPRLFAEGVISTPFDEFGSAFARDGRTVFFTRSVPRSNVYVICQSGFRNGRWSDPEVAPFSGQYWDFDPVISPDGSKLFFASDRPAPGEPRKDKDFDIWEVDKTTSGWDRPKHLDANVNSGEDETFASAAANGTLYFVSGREGGRAHLAIYRSKPQGSGYGAPEKLKGPINDAENSSLEALVAPDETFILLTPMGRRDGFGSFDIYVSYQREGEWTIPQNLGPKINTRARDYSPRFSPDGKYLFWASERGFATDPLERPLTFPEMERGLRSTLNGWGNIYQIDLSAVGLELKR
jgi:Tol biopolymer transport system component